MDDNIQDAPTIHDELEQTKKKLNFEYKTKIYVVLEDSNIQDYGLVKDTLGDINWVPGKGETIGTWSRSGWDNLIHISILPAIEALYDKSVKMWTEIIEKRKITSTKSQSRRRIPSVGSSDKKQKPEPEQSTSDETKIAFSDLKAKLLNLRKV